jgi:hypothetical protein
MSSEELDRPQVPKTLGSIVFIRFWQFKTTQNKVYGQVDWFSEYRASGILGFNAQSQAICLNFPWIIHEVTSGSGCPTLKIPVYIVRRHSRLLPRLFTVSVCFLLTGILQFSVPHRYSDVRCDPFQSMTSNKRFLLPQTLSKPLIWLQLSWMIGSAIHPIIVKINRVREVTSGQLLDRSHSYRTGLDTLQRKPMPTFGMISLLGVILRTCITEL